MKQNNRIILDLNKAQWARFYYENQHGDKRNLKPTSPTVYNTYIDINNTPVGQPTKTMIVYAKEQKLLDVWTPCVVFKLTAHECLKYKGDKAVSLYEAWKEKIFNRKK